MRFLKIQITAFIVLLQFVAAAGAKDLVIVPPGNRNVAQPSIPMTSSLRQKATGSTYDENYRKIVGLVREDRQLVSSIENAAKAYGIAPIHIVGALVGEHTYNVTVVDRIKLYYVKALAYSDADFTFRYKGTSIQDFVTKSEFAECNNRHGSAELWECRDEVWDQVFRGRTVEGVQYDNIGFQRAFFQPMYGGQTFGLGQISPLTALEASDLVHKVSGLEPLSADKPQAVYRDVIDPERGVLYIAAILADAIEAYRTQGFDISNNPGLTATLYNLGQPRRRVRALREAADREGKSRLPQENYYGWLVNEKLDELKNLVSSQTGTGSQPAVGEAVGSIRK